MRFDGRKSYASRTKPKANRMLHPHHVEQLNKQDTTTMSKQALLSSTTASRSNSSGLVAFGDDMLAQATLPAQQRTGALWQAVEHADVIESLMPRLTAPNANKRDILLTFWREQTPAGIKFAKAFEDLKAEEDRTTEQRETFAEMQGQLKAINTNFERAVDVFKGMQVLTNAKRSVNVRKVPGMNKVYKCYVIYTTNPSLKANEQEEEKVSFNVGALVNVNYIADKITPDMSTTAIRKLASSFKLETPNDNKGGTVVDRSKLGEMAKVMDTALVGVIQDGKIEGVSTEARDNMLAVWARLDFELSADEKAKARAAFAKLAAPIAPAVVPNVVDKVKAVIAKKKTA